MPNIRFILDNVVDDSALTWVSGDVIDTDYPLDNVKKISRSKPVRTVDTSQQTVIIAGVLNSAQSISALVLARHNFSTNVTYKLELFTSSTPGTGLIYNSTALTVTAEQSASDLYQWGEFGWGTVPWGANKTDSDNRQFYDIVLWLNQTYDNVQSFKLTVGTQDAVPSDLFWCDDITISCDDDTVTCDMIGSGGSPGSGETGIPYFEIGRIYLGEWVSPEYNLSAGHNISWTETTSQYRPTSGTLRSDVVSKNKKFEFALQTIPTNDKRDLHKQLISKGLRDDFYISIFPENTSSSKEIDYSTMVKLTKIPKYTNFISGYHKSSFTMEEV